MQACTHLQAVQCNRAGDVPVCSSQVICSVLSSGCKLRICPALAQLQLAIVQQAGCCIHIYELVHGQTQLHLHPLWPAKVTLLVNLSASMLACSQAMQLGYKEPSHEC